MKQKTAALYMRVSTEEQARHGDSIEAQRQALREYAVAHDLVIVGEYADEGISGQKPVRKRPALSEMLAEVEAGKIDLILFTKLDRWFRSVKLYYQAQEVLDRHRVAWRAILEDYNTESADGILKVNIMLSVAQNEAERTSERIKFVFADKVRRGEPISGNMPMGYKIETRDGKKRVIKDPDKEQLVNEIIQAYLTNHSIRRTTIEINARHEQHFDQITIKNLLRNEMLCGSYRGNPNYCEAYITPEQHRQIIDRWNNNVRQNSVEPYYFSGLLRCPVCGCKIAGSRIQSRRNKKIYLYKNYRCGKYYGSKTCTWQRIVNENTMERYILDRIEKDMDDLRSKREQWKQAPQPNIARRRADIKKEMERLSYVFTKGRLDPEEYDRRYDALESELASLKAPDPVPEFKPLPHGWKKMYDGLDAAGKQAFWHGIIKEIRIVEWEKNSRKVDIIFF